MKPMIAMTSRSKYADPSNKMSRYYYDNESYFKYIEAGGGFPVMLSTVSEEDAKIAAETFDGLLLTGGEDVDPARYGEENTASDIIDADIEISDFLLYKAFKEAGKPILGICRGVQVIAAAEGMGLIQDIPSAFHTQHRQNGLVANNLPFHDARFIEGTRLHAIFGDVYGVNSFHHQALKGCPEGFSLSCFAEEGFPEAIEKEHVTAVQWHPERMLDDPKHKQIVIDFINDCRENSAR